MIFFKNRNEICEKIYSKFKDFILKKLFLVFVFLL